MTNFVLETKEYLEKAKTRTDFKEIAFSPKVKGLIEELEEYRKDAEDK